ncbi:MAG TPA: ABC transporter permease [Anaerolineae bacterium]|nr:ABC transporter permease [Anaerolineae bacterium]
MALLETTNVTNPPIIRVRPLQRWEGVNLREMWEHRDLVEALIRRDLKLRYQQTLGGVLWVLIQPILTTVVLSALLTRLVGQTWNGIPYPLFVYAALVPWAYFSHALTKVTYCFIEHAPMVTRVYFPRLLLPLAVILAALADFIIAFLFLPILMIYFGVIPSATILALPFVLVLMMVSVFGIGLWLCSFNAEFRDIAYALPFVLQLGLFVTPMFYSSEIVPLPWRFFYALNPMVGVVEGMRWALLNPQQPAPLLVFAASTLSALVIFIGGVYVFQRRDTILADVI